MSVLHCRLLSARASGRLKRTLWVPGPRDPTETETELCLSVSCGGTGQQWTAAGTGALGAGDGYGISPLVGGHINPAIELADLTLDWEIDSWREQQKLVCTWTQQKGAVSPQRLTEPCR